MSKIAYYIVLPILYIISLLPFPVLYLLSDVIFFIVYYLFGYRKKVVYRNLKNSFPHKSEDELLKIQRDFFRHFCDLILETLKTLTITKSQIIKRCQFTNRTIELFNELNSREQSCILVMGHFGNWEWAGSAFSLTFKQQLYVIYHPLRNKNFNNLVYRMRTRFGTKLYAMRDTVREMLKNKQETNATAFIADQTPAPESAYWTTFLNQETPVFWGTEKIAQKLNYPVVYVTINKTKRGYYSINASYLIMDPKFSKEGEISELHTRKLEDDINLQPENWLWSHKRWKHKRRK